MKHDARILIWQSKSDQLWYWALDGGNGECAATAEGSPTRAGAAARARRAKVLMAEAEIVYVTGRR